MRIDSLHTEANALWQFALPGASGGTVTEIVTIFRWVGAWQDAQRNIDRTLRRSH